MVQPSGVLSSGSKATLSAHYRTRADAVAALGVAGIAYDDAGCVGLWLRDHNGHGRLTSDMAGYTFVWGLY